MASASVLIAISAYHFGSPVLQSIRISERMAHAFQSSPCPDGAWASTGYAEPSLVFLTRTDLHLVSADGVEDWPRLAKDEVARRLVSALAARLGSKR